MRNSPKESGSLPVSRLSRAQTIADNVLKMLVLYVELTEPLMPLPLSSTCVKQILFHILIVWVLACQDQINCSKSR